MTRTTTLTGRSTGLEEVRPLCSGPLASALSNCPAFDQPASPTEAENHDSPEFISPPAVLSDDEDEESAPEVPKKKGGYDSRIEQILYEHPDLEIQITDAGKSLESGGSYIVYTIRTGVSYPSSSRYTS